MSPLQRNLDSITKVPFKKSRLFSAAVAGLVLASTTQAQSTRIENVTVYAGKQHEVTVDLNAVDTKFDATHAILTPGGPYLKQRLPLHNEEAFDIALSDHHAFIAVANDGLMVIDISPAATPTVIARLKLPHTATQLTIIADRLYIAGDQQLSIVDISQPTAPKIMGQYTTRVAITTIDALANGFAVLLLANNTLLVLNTVVANKPRLLSSTELDGISHALSMSESRIYLAMGDAGVTVLNSSDPTAITTLYQYITTGAAVDIKQHDGTLYVATTGGITLFDIKTPDRFVWLGSHQKVGHATHIDVAGEKVMVLNDDNQLALLDVGMPNMPSIIATYNEPQQTQRPLTAFAQHGKRLFAISPHELLEYDFATPPPQVSNEGLDFGQGVNFGGQRRGFIRDDILYVADWFSGIHLYDISAPHRPVLLSSLKTKGSPKGIVVRDDYAYVADDDHGLLIVDISDANQPKRVSTLQTPGLAYIPQLQGDLLYLASHRGGFQIIDISEATKPKLISSVNTPGKAWGIQVNDKLTFIADDEAGLLIFDTSQPAAPKQIGQFMPGGAAEDVLIDGKYAFVSFFDNGVYIVDISDPANPAAISHVPTPGNARGIERKGNHLYIADWLAGIQVIDISEPMQPRIVGSFDTEGAAWGLRLKDEHAYVFDWWGGLSVIDIQHPQRPTLIGRYLGNDPIQQIATRDKFLFAASGRDGLQIFDINNPLNPTWFTGVNLESAALSVIINHHYAYIAQDNQYISIIDISNPFQAELVKQIKLGHNADIIRVGKDQLYVAERGNAVTVIDITKPQAPLIRTTYHVGLIDLWNDDNTLFLATDEQRIEIIDSSNPARPQRLHSFQLAANAQLLRSQKEMLYLYLPNEAILMINIQNPSAPRVVGKIPVATRLSDFHIEGTSLFAAMDGRYLYQYDISQPQQWQLVNRYHTATHIERFDLHKGVLYFAGSANIIALQPLPTLDITMNATTPQLSTTLPKEMPLGGYHLIMSDDANNTTTLFNAIQLEMKPFGQNSLSLPK